jgi:antitoxin (DNA-binding transcriptional repressor) of toxin-antitoxin stability system
VYLRRVENGESFEVTDRGRPVARLGPLHDLTDPLAGLVAAGDARPATGSIAELAPPRSATTSLRMSLSEALAQLRSDER